MSQAAKGKGKVMRESSRLSARLAVVPVIAFLLVGLAACGSPKRPTSLPTRTSPVAAFSFPPQEGTNDNFGVTTDGLEFVPWVDIEVTALGYYDDGRDGLVSSHSVGIFDAASRELVTPEVTVDSQSALEGFYRYEPIAPVVLKEGRAYLVAGGCPRPFDKSVNKPHGLVWAPEVRFTRYRVGHGVFRYPTSTPPQLWIQPNFKFMPVSAASPTP